MRHSFVRNLSGLVSVLILGAALGVSAAAGTRDEPQASVVIASPGHGETRHDNTGRLPVRLSINGRYDAVRVVLDGIQHGALQRTHAFTLENVHRGEHTLQVHLLDWSGNLLVASEPVVFYMWHASKLLPRRKQ